MSHLFRVVALAPLLWAGATVEAAAQQQVGCWHTAQSARDYRRLCIMPDYKVHITTSRTGTKSRCDTYPVAAARRNGDALVFDVQPVRNNCHLPDGQVVSSIAGSFKCTFQGSDKLVCSTGWQGWETIQEIYTRR